MKLDVCKKCLDIVTYEYETLKVEAKLGKYRLSDPDLILRKDPRNGEYSYWSCGVRGKDKKKRKERIYT